MTAPVGQRTVRFQSQDSIPAASRQPSAENRVHEIARERISVGHGRREQPQGSPPVARSIQPARAFQVGVAFRQEGPQGHQGGAPRGQNLGPQARAPVGHGHF